MNMKITLIGFPLLITSAVLQADEITDIADSTMQQTPSRLQTELQSMSREDRALFEKLNENGELINDGSNRKVNGSGKGTGDKIRLRDGSSNDSGAMNRYGQGGGYGSGYGSRNASGRSRRQ